MDRGRTMYLYDRAAWLTSDDLVKRLSRDRQPEIGGWIVTPAVGGLHVDYFGQGAAADRVIYSADVKNGAVGNAAVYRAAEAPTLGEPALQMARALRAGVAEMAGRNDRRPCANARFNSIVLPPGKDGVIPVYFLTPQTQRGSLPFGGHYKLDMSPAGKVSSSRAFTRSCVTLSHPPASSGARPAALVLTHNLDPHPTEIHVFQQYYAGVPLLVATGPKTIWKVERGRVDDVSAMLAK